MESHDALKKSLSCFKSNNVFESFSKSTLLDLRAQSATHKTRKKYTPRPVPEKEEGPVKRSLYLTWFINEVEHDNEEFMERVPDKFKAVKQRVESHVKRYYPACELADDYWQMEIEVPSGSSAPRGVIPDRSEAPIRVSTGPLRPPGDCSIYTTLGVYIRVVFSFRSM